MFRFNFLRKEESRSKLRGGKFSIVEMKIDGVKRDILIDSGATTEMVEENVPYLKEERVSESVEYADGLREKIEKKRLIELETIDGFRFKIWALVVKKLPEKVILGNTFLSSSSSSFLLFLLSPFHFLSNRFFLL